jgi:HD-GYP domain-containing protein (c-di-GMP phosphodiesterase class II)
LSGLPVRSYKLGPSAVRESLWAREAHEAVGDRKKVAAISVNWSIAARRHAISNATRSPAQGGQEDKEAWLRRCLLELATSAGLRDDPTGAHGARVGYLAELMGRVMGLGSQTCESLRLAGALHDIGKLVLPQAILLKRDTLSDEERAVVRKHAVLGEQLLSTFELADTEMVASVARSHHERWNGDGYPDKLAGEAIPLAARIVSVAEVFDTLVFPRPYRTRGPLAGLGGNTPPRGHHFDERSMRWKALSRISRRSMATSWS